MLGGVVCQFGFQTLPKVAREQKEYECTRPFSRNEGRSAPAWMHSGQGHASVYFRPIDTAAEMRGVILIGVAEAT